MLPIIIHHANQGNLNDISLEIKRNKITMVTGISGSGKTTLLFDVLFNECQRQYLEAMQLEGIAKPWVEKIENVSPAICITQNRSQYSVRSSVGTMTQIYTNLRMVYEKLAMLECPHCQFVTCALDVVEEIVKEGNEDIVYAICPCCKKRYKKITRSHFSFNTKEGACPKCDGLGTLLELDLNKVLDENLSIRNGGVFFLKGKYLDYLMEKFERAINCEIADVLLKNYTDTQWKQFIYGEGSFEGIHAILLRRLESSHTNKKYFIEKECDECFGERLNTVSRHVVVNQIRLPELVKYPLDKLYAFINELLTVYHEKTITYYLEDIKTKLYRLIKVGLGYLTLDRFASTLSGGELQRIKLSALLDTTMTGLIYILDEPTMGLHPKDTLGIMDIIKQLRDLGNTILIIEHDLDILKLVDEIIDIGPFAGSNGGQVVFQGDYLQLLKDHHLTAQYINKKEKAHDIVLNNSFIRLNQASKNNLKNIDVKIPMKQMTCVTGVSGSGKSSLIFDDLLTRLSSQENGLIYFDKIISLTQNQIHRTKRSNIITYMNLFREIRECFATIASTNDSSLSAKDFSFNIHHGRCENCQGLGYVTHNMLFFKDTQMICPVCHGERFKIEVLQIKYQEKNINEILQLSIDESVLFFKGNIKLVSKLQLLQKVGLGYLELGQTLTTLSNGEGQRLNLAKSIIEEKGKHHLYLFDEPSIGLHPYDIEQFTYLLKELKDNGHTLIIIEHNLQLIANSDYVIDLGLEGGNKGGYLVYQGKTIDFINHPTSYTAKYFKKYIS